MGKRKIVPFWSRLGPDRAVEINFVREGRDFLLEGVVLVNKRKNVVVNLKNSLPISRYVFVQ